ARPPNAPTAPRILKRRLAGGATAVALVNQDPGNCAMPSTPLGALGPTGSSYGYKGSWSGATRTTTGTIGRN
ncbi:hypothetical protein UK12_34935, partial [Saccharothrix sp. ST-888]